MSSLDPFYRCDRCNRFGRCTNPNCSELHCECYPKDDGHPPRVSAPVVPGVGKDAPTVVNDAGAKQSASPYRCDLLPARAALAVAAVLRHGADKYGAENWRGIPVADHLNHAITHLFAHLAGDEQDDHLEHAACRLLMALDIALVERAGRRVAVVESSP